VDTVSTFMMVFSSIGAVLHRPTFLNLRVLLRGALLSSGDRTVTGCLRAAWPWVRKHFSSYENVLRRSRLEMRGMSKGLFRLILGLLPDDAAVVLIVDETLVRRYGPYVAGIGVHRDPLRSSGGSRGLSLGHKWVVLSVAVKLPFMRCVLALPVLSYLYVSPCKARRSRVEVDVKHRSPALICKGLVSIVVGWAPERKFILVADKVFGSHDLADTFNPKGANVRLRSAGIVSRMQPDAGLYAPPPVCVGGRGRRRVKGAKLPNPAQEAACEDASWERADVGWYGGSVKTLLLLSGEGLWYKCGSKATWVRWVYVRDPDGKRREEVFFTTDTGLDAVGIVELYVSRWSLETTFEETKRHLGVETLRNRMLTSVQRSVPLLLSLYSLVIVWFASGGNGSTARIGNAPWYRKDALTFSDILDAARDDVLRDAEKAVREQIILRRAALDTGEFLFAPFPLRRIYETLAKKTNAA
jgi:hypothetical protein